MEITDAVIDDMYKEYMRDKMREHHNAITTTEVEMKFDKVVAEIRALESYLGCFEREWNVSMTDLKTILVKNKDVLEKVKIVFMNKTYNLMEGDNGDNGPNI